MLISLIGGIPFALKKLEDVGTKIARPWEDWNLLASGMVEILRRIITEAEKLAKEAKEQEEAKRQQLTTANEDIKVGANEEEGDVIAIEINEDKVSESATEIKEAQTTPLMPRQDPKRFGKKKRR